MGHLPILRPFGSPVIGGTGEKNGFGSPVIRRDVQGLTSFGYLATGRQEGEVGSGIDDVGSIGEKKTVRSFNLTKLERSDVRSGFAGNSSYFGDLSFSLRGKKAS